MSLEGTIGNIKTMTPAGKVQSRGEIDSPYLIVDIFRSEAEGGCILITFWERRNAKSLPYFSLFLHFLIPMWIQKLHINIFIFLKSDADVSSHTVHHNILSMCWYTAYIC